MNNSGASVEFDLELDVLDPRKTESNKNYYDNLQIKKINHSAIGGLGSLRDANIKPPESATTALPQNSLAETNTANDNDLMI